MSDHVRKYESAQTSHRHDGFHQIIVPVTGNLELDVDGRQGLVNGNTIGVVVQGETHAFRSEGDNRFLVLDIPDLVDGNLEKVWSQASETPFLSMSQALVSLTDYALFCAQNDKTHSCLETWQKLFIQTLACDLENDLPDLPARLQKAIDYMQANMARPISNTDLADAVSLSPARFYEVFKRATGITPQQYLTDSRLKYSRRLIKNGMSLAEVADEVGFSDQSSFGRAFRKTYGLSPAQWRKSESETKKS